MASILQVKNIITTGLFFLLAVLMLRAIHPIIDTIFSIWDASFLKFTAIAIFYFITFSVIGYFTFFKLLKAPEVNQ